MRLVLISDTHGRYEPFLPDGDVLIHAGDHSMEGTPPEVWSSIKWLGLVRTNYKHVVVIAGNHDFFAQDYPKTMHAMCEEYGLVYLHDSAAELDGVLYWGSPMTPEFCGWAFMAPRGEAMHNHWAAIPKDVDVLITHGPPHGILDHCPESVGCEALRHRVQVLKPKLHVFGHIHQARGEDELPYNPTRFVNASMLNELYVPHGDGVFTFDLE